MMKAEWDSAVTEAANRAGLNLSFVPDAAGGTLKDFADTAVEARRWMRLSTAVMPRTMFEVTPLMCLLIHGADEQVSSAVSTIKAGGHLTFALSEATSGSDLLSNEAFWSRDNDLLGGTKWLVRHGPAASFVYLVVKSGRRGPGAFSGLFVPGDALESRWRGPRTSVGLGDSELWDLDLSGAGAQAEWLVGREGEAFEVCLKTMQVVRVLSLSGTLGCLDQAMWEAWTTARGRLASGDGPADLPQEVISKLSVAVSGIVVLETVQNVAARMLHLDPQQGTLASACAKRIAVIIADIVMRALGDVIGARSVLSDSLMPQLRHDIECLRYIDTSPAATRLLIANHWSAVRRSLDSGTMSVTAEGILDGRTRLPEFDPSGLDVITRVDPLLSSGRKLVGEAAARAKDPILREALSLLEGDLDALTRVDTVPDVDMVALTWGALAVLGATSPFPTRNGTASHERALLHALSVCRRALTPSYQRTDIEFVAGFITELEQDTDRDRTAFYDTGMIAPPSSAVQKESLA